MRKGFTLVEMMIVMVIIAILIAVLLPTFLSYRQDAYLARARAELETIGLAVNQYYLRVTPSGADESPWYVNPGLSSTQPVATTNTGLAFLTTSYLGPAPLTRVPIDPFNPTRTYAYAIIIYTGSTTGYQFSLGAAPGTTPVGSWPAIPPTSPAPSTQVGFIVASKGNSSIWSDATDFENITTGTGTAGLLSVLSADGTVYKDRTMLAYSNYRVVDRP